MRVFRLRGRGLLATFVVPLALAVVTTAQARTVTLGFSVQGRAITAQVLGPNSAPRKILLIGCIHGNECAGRTILSAVARLPVRRGVQLWLVQEINPDGTAADTRQNAHGVDLNRNFPYQWQRISDPTFYSGPHPASEPETRVAIRWILAGRNLPPVPTGYCARMVKPQVARHDLIRRRATRGTGRQRRTPPTPPRGASDGAG